MTKFKLLLIIDDSEMDSFVTKIVVERVKLAESVVCLTNAYNALEYVRSLKVRVDKEGIELTDLCIFLDVMMPYMNAGDFLVSLDKIWPSLIQKVYIVSGLPAEEQSKVVGRNDIAGFLNKPITDEKLRNSFLRKELN